MLGATVNERVSSEGGTPVAGQLGWKAVASAGPWRAATTLPGTRLGGERVDKQAGEHDHARAGPEDRRPGGDPCAAGRLGRGLGQFPDRGGLPAGVRAGGRGMCHRQALGCGSPGA